MSDNSIFDKEQFSHERPLVPRRIPATVVPPPPTFPGAVRNHLDWNTSDINGYVPDHKLIGLVLKHSGNGQFYTLTEFVWNGDNDQWYFLAVCTYAEPPVRIVRPISHIDGLRDNGERRYAVYRTVEGAVA